MATRGGFIIHTVPGRTSEAVKPRTLTRSVTWRWIAAVVGEGEGGYWAV